MLQSCFIKESDKIPFSLVPPVPKQGHLEQIKECLHCQNLLKVHLERKEKNQQPRIIVGKFRQLSAYNSFGGVKKKNPQKSPSFLILLVPSCPVPRFINKRHTLKYFITWTLYVTFTDHKYKLNNVWGTMSAGKQLSAQYACSKNSQIIVFHSHIINWHFNLPNGRHRIVSHLNNVTSRYSP